jgi:hypothetical protein
VKQVNSAVTAVRVCRLVCCGFLRRSTSDLILENRTKLTDTHRQTYVWAHLPWGKFPCMLTPLLESTTGFGCIKIISHHHRAVHCCIFFKDFIIVFYGVVCWRSNLWSRYYLFLILQLTLYFINWNGLTLDSNINHIYKQWFYKTVMPSWDLIGNNSSYIISCIQAWWWSHKWSKHVALHFINNSLYWNCDDGFILYLITCVFVYNNWMMFCTYWSSTMPMWHM